MALKDQPYIPLFVQDVLTDEKLIECSASAQGIYFRLICILHKQPEYGNFLLKQKYKQSSKQVENFATALVKPLSFTKEIIYDALVELIDEDVIQISANKISQKRMIRDSDISDKRSKAGSKGGNTTHKKDKKPTNFAKANIKANSENEYEDEDESEDEIDTTNKIPTQIEFLKFVEEWMTENNKDFNAKKTQVITKYQTWVDAGWKDGYNKPIINWRLKFQNVEPHLKKDYGTTTPTNLSKAERR